MIFPSPYEKMSRLGCALYQNYRNSGNAAASDHDTIGVVVMRSSKDVTQLWTIHGHEYDLQKFVQHHPGGKESILLGQGRDCTALFESYHPFSSSTARAVLAKYSVAKVPPQLPRDAFYGVLCQRVRDRLRECGIDPIHNRGASYQRLAYYGVLVAFVFVTGYFHIQVCAISESNRVLL